MAADGLSSILGWISIACWIVVYSPQVIKNYTRQSGEGLSVLFVITWLLGDITNLLGAVLAGLLPTIIILGIYYTTCDTTLLFQIYYFRWKKRHIATSLSLEDQETDPLLRDTHIEEEVIPLKSLALRYSAALTFVVTVGLMAWWIPQNEEDKNLVHSPTGKGKWWTIQVLGWSSALLFLGARVPQILRNFETRCEGLSPAFFFFAIFGNSTYSMSICAKSMDREYILRNGGWLAGSAFTVILDIFVLCQFSYYRYTDKIKPVRNDAETTD